MSRTRPALRTAPLAVGLAVVLALSGCQTMRDEAPGGDDAGTSSPEDPVSSDDPVTDDPGDDGADEPADGSDDPASPATPVAVDITVTVDATGEGATTTFTLTCEPTGGDHPDADAACAAIAAAGGTAAFEPTPRDVACTEQWGGPQTARVEGTVDGTTVRADFSRSNGCEISRWAALEAVFGPGGLL